jgi:hypothetical protein
MSREELKKTYLRNEKKWLKIRNYRFDNGISNEELSSKMGCSESDASRIVCMKIGRFSVSKLANCLIN